MPVFAMVLLARVIPDYLTSMLFEPVGKVLSTAELTDGDLDALAREAATYNVEYLGAHHPASDGGAAVTPREKAHLRDHARRMAGTARAAAA